MDRRTLIALAAGAALFPATSALAITPAISPEDEQLIRDIGEHNSAIQTMVGRFLQIDTQGKRIEGTFFLERPDKIRFRYNPPSREEIISIGRGFYVVDRKEKTQYVYPQDRVPLRQFLQSRIDFFQSNIIAFTKSDSYAVITLSDDTPIGTVEVSLIFDVDSKDLVQWTLSEPSGVELTFSLYDVEKGIDIPKSFFYIDPTFKAVEPQT